MADKVLADTLPVKMLIRLLIDSKMNRTTIS